MSDKRFSDTVEHGLGIVGLFLMLVLARLAEPAYSPRRTPAARLSGFAARRAIDVIAAIGWLADRLPAPAPVGSFPQTTTSPLRTHAVARAQLPLFR